MTRRFATLILISFFATISPANAQVVDYWGIGSDATDFHEAGNWIERGGPLRLPGPSDLAVIGDINNGAPAGSITLNFVQNEQVDSLRNGISGAGNTNTINHSAGTLTIAPDPSDFEDVGLWLGEFGDGDECIYNLTGGDIVSTEPEFEAMQIGRGIKATFTMSAGTSVTLDGTLSVGKFGPLGDGTLNMNGGTITCGLSGNNNNEAMFVGQNGGIGAVNMTAGTMNVGAAGTDDGGNPIRLGVLHIGLDSTATWTQSSGVVDAVAVEIGRFQSPFADVFLSGDASWSVEDNIALSGGSSTFANAISSLLEMNGSGLTVNAGGLLFGEKSMLSYVADGSGTSMIVLDGTGDLHDILTGADLMIDLTAWTDNGSDIVLVDGVKAWTGEFDGLPEGTVVPGTNGRTISYVFGDGFDIALVATVTDPIVTPDSFTVTRGSYVAGGVAELAESDNADLTIQRSNLDIQSRTEFECKGVSPLAIPSSMEVTLEGSVFARSQVIQTIELFNYDTSSWEQVDSRNANRFSDTTVNVTVNGDVTRFVEPGTNCVEARIRYQSPSQRQRFSSNTDQFIWTIN